MEEKENSNQEMCQSNRFLVTFPQEIGIQDWWVKECVIGDLAGEEYFVSVKYVLSRDCIKKLLSLNSIKFAMKVEMLDSVGQVIFTYLFDDCVVNDLRPYSLNYEKNELATIDLGVLAKTVKIL